MELRAGDMYLNPAKIPHSPIRSEGSIGLVIELKRAGKGFTDGLLWFCEKCNHKLHEVFFELHDIEKDFLPHYQNFYNTEKLRTCTNCGTIMETDSRYL
jgi:3-hydroxyanthranilate 3,4-dioxygenase